jgi:hypothetical protein
MLLVAESKSYSSAPAWWDKMTREQQQAYLKKRKNSGLKEFLKGADRGKKGAEEKPARKSRVKEPVPIKKPRGGVSEKAAAAKPAAKPRKTTKQTVIKEPVVPTRRIKRKEDRPAAEPEVSAVLTEKLTRNEVKKRAGNEAPKLRAEAAVSLMKFNDRVSNVANFYDGRVSASGKGMLTGYLNAKRNGEAGPDTDRGKKLAIRIATGVAVAALGLGALVAVSTGVAPVAGALVAAFLGFDDFKFGMDEAEAPDIDNMETDPWQSQSSIQQNPVQMFVDEFAVWLNNQDIDDISYKIAEYNALVKMEEEQWAPNVSMLSDDELASMETEAEREAGTEETEEDSEDFVSESSVSPRLSFRLSAEVKRLPQTDRKQYDILFSGRRIGLLKAENDGSRRKRQWTIVLEDGFNEAIFRSGKSETEPYTLVKGSSVVLVNPIKQSLAECCQWVRKSVEKNYL